MTSPTAKDVANIIDRVECEIGSLDAASLIVALFQPLAEENGKLREALKPFIDFIAKIDADPDGYQWKDHQHILIGLSAGDFRKLRALADQGGTL